MSPRAAEPIRVHLGVRLVADERRVGQDAVDDRGRGGRNPLVHQRIGDGLRPGGVLLALHAPPSGAVPVRVCVGGAGRRPGCARLAACNPLGANALPPPGPAASARWPRAPFGAVNPHPGKGLRRARILSPVARPGVPRPPALREQARSLGGTGGAVNRCPRAPIPAPSRRATGVGHHPAFRPNRPGGKPGRTVKRRHYPESRPAAAGRSASGFASQTLTVPSQNAPARRQPSGLKATLRT